jgi:transcriptional regulator with GAF, ATPase, and Fis domain
LGVVPAKLTLFPSEEASRHFVLREEAGYSLGRDPASDIVLDDPRVSANHALLRFSDPEWLLVDRQSKNGTFVSAIRVTEAPLRDEDWLSFGGLLARFELISEAEVEKLRSERTRRLQTFSEARRILDSKREPQVLLTALMGSVLELTSAERGFLLLFAPEGGVRAEVVSGFSGVPALDERFSGSFGAIERVLRSGRSVVTSNATADAYLGGRRSVVEMGIETLACVPLRSEGKVVGLIYVDGRKRGGVFTDLDLEILEALADHAAVVAGSLSLDRQIRQLVGATASEPAGAAFLDDFERRMAQITASSSPS